MTDSLLEPALSLPSLLSTAALLGSDDDDGDEGLEHDVDFTPTAIRYANLNEDKEEDEEGDYGDDPPSMTLRDILLNATGHFHLLGSFQLFFFFHNSSNF